ncbi:hypothetical protein GCM10025867_12900 [Frondihabitans sucicola]|uniref:DUF3052 domain-containing protein n=1 Tax=Frondihabitans sucicola TaxID=1268041 RepID=A0ABN6XVJ5_9MICO|nr:DUF3052 family protein [Frondihabitans sucicola]BDZ49049.1 hypothetical protein GCM10025867_12900 [Frondihabitans sucicola]
METTGQPASQAKKLGLADGVRLAVDEAPEGWSLADPPDGLVRADVDEQADVVLAFVTRAADLPVRLPILASRIFPGGVLWIAWPRRAGGHTSDLTDVVVRDAALETGLVDTKVAAVDEDWSGLKFVWRFASRRGAL